MSFRLHTLIAVSLMTAFLPISFCNRVSAQPPPAPPEQGAQEQPESQPEQVPLPRVPTRPAVAQSNLFRTAFGRSPYSASRQRLARAPDMFGDTVMLQFLTLDPCALNPQGRGCDLTNLSLIQPGGGGFKISDNGEVLPVDRVFVNYNHFHNPIVLQGPDYYTSGNFDRVTLGVEKTFANGAHSIEMRMPLSGGMNATIDRIGTDPLGLSGGELGNLTLVFKTLFYQDRSTAFGGGLALEIPTGEDIFLTTPSNGIFEFENQAFHLHPFLGYLRMTEDNWFFSSYLQFDAGLNDNPLYQTVATGRQRLGDAAPWSVVMFDVNLGKWIYRNLDTDGITGIAPLLELHFLSTVDDIDRFNGNNSGLLRSARDSFQSLNLTAGTHIEINGYSALRVAAVSPLLGQRNRMFDAEIQVQYTIHY